MEQASLKTQTIKSPELGVCYYPEHWPESQWSRDAQAMIEMGLSWVRIGEFSWSRLEPKSGEYDWDWLDRAINILGQAGLKIVLGTPSATPPYWMLSRFPDMIAINENGEPRKFGSRRHYSHSHKAYRQAAANMAALMSKRYGQHPHIHAWQIDNEYGCHDTVLSYDDCARENFRDWLRHKYKTIDALNEAWGNIFWSMEYPNFEAIDLPNQTVTEANPSHVMDFRRFASNEVVIWNKAQVDAIRTYSDRPISHNYMGRVLEFDHFDLGRDLEIATWDSYPLGFLEDRSDQNQDFKRRYARQGDPDFQAFHHDLYRAVGGMKSESSRWWVMEQQPGPVNWAPYNPAPLPGMVKLWSWEAIAHGAEVVSYFRWRQLPFAQEQMHAGLLSQNSAPMPVAQDIKSLVIALSHLEDIKTAPSKIAIVFDYASAWAWDIQPQGKTFNYFRLVYDLYSHLRKRGYSIDIIPPDTSDFGQRDCVFIPGLMAWNSILLEAISHFQGNVVIGPRTGSKTDTFQIPDALAPNIPLMDISIPAVESLRPDRPVPITAGGAAYHWREFAQTTEECLWAYEDDHPALICKDNLFYLTGWLEEEAYDNLFKTLNLKRNLLPEGVRCRDLGEYQFYFNYGEMPQSIDLKSGATHISSAGVLLVEKESHTPIKI